MSPVQNANSSDSDDPSTEQKSKATVLPPPKKNVKKSVFYVNLPAKDDSDDEEEHEARQAKRQKASTSSTSLSDLLPAPKNASTKQLNKAAPPLAVPRPAKKEPAPETVKEQRPADIDDNDENDDNESNVSDDEKSESTSEEEKDTAEKSNDKDDSEDEKVSSSKTSSPFFHLGAHIAKPSSRTQSKKASQPARVKAATISKNKQVHKKQEPSEPQHMDDPNAIYAYNAGTTAYSQNYVYQSQEPGIAGPTSETLDAEVFSQLGDRHRGEVSGVQIKSITQSELLPSDEWRRRALEMEPVALNNTVIKVNNDQRRTNNIKSLMADAQQMQAQNEQRFAQEKLARKEAKKKYGF